MVHVVRPVRGLALALSVVLVAAAAPPAPAAPSARTASLREVAAFVDSVVAAVGQVANGREAMGPAVAAGSAVHAASADGGSTVAVSLRPDAPAPSHWPAVAIDSRPGAPAALAIGWAAASEGAATVAVAKAASGGPSAVVRTGAGGGGRVPTAGLGSFGRVTIPAIGLSGSVDDWGCRGGVLPNRIERWGCAGAGNTYLMGHAYGVFARLRSAYAAGSLRAGLVATLVTRSGSRSYRLAWARIVPASYLYHGMSGDQWAWGSTGVRSLTLQTCWGAGDRYRLIVRFVAVG